MNEKNYPSLSTLSSTFTTPETTNCITALGANESQTKEGKSEAIRALNISTESCATRHKDKATKTLRENHLASRRLCSAEFSIKCGDRTKTFLNLQGL